MLVPILLFVIAVVCFYMAYRGFHRCKNCGKSKAVRAGYCQNCYDQINGLLKNSKQIMLSLAQEARPDLTPQQKNDIIIRMVSAYQILVKYQNFPRLKSDITLWKYDILSRLGVEPTQYDYLDNPPNNQHEFRKRFYINWIVLTVLCFLIGIIYTVVSTSIINSIY